jgi:hypothetical protein
MSGIIWIASYPKSGNTWMRIFLARMVGENTAEIGLNTLGRTLHDGLGIASDRKTFDDLAGLDASDLLPDEIDRLRPRVFEEASARAAKSLFVKVHDAFLPTPAGEQLIPLSVTRAVVYIVRNPLDVAVSFAFHAGVDFDTAITRMNNPDFEFAASRTRLPTQLRQRLSNWSGHVASWIDAPGLSVHLVRYEDMSERPTETFSAVAQFLALPGDSCRVGEAIEHARFERLSAEEDESGFVEKPPQMDRFFRAGRVGGWRAYLSDRQAQQVASDHNAMMRRLGYLDFAGRLLY